MRHYFTLLSLLVVISAHAQNDAELSISPQSSYDSIRLKYIHGFPDHFFLYPVLKQRRQNFDLKSLASGNTFSYKSNKPYSFGVGTYLFELGVELAFAVPLNEQDRYIYGKSDAQDLQLNIFGKKWGIDAFHQKYSGYYLIDPTAPVPTGSPYPQRPDINTKNVGVTVNYTFNNKKFSFRSVYNFAERQLQSSGSFVIFGSVSSFKAGSDSAMLGKKYDGQFGEAAYIHRVKTSILGIAPGYTYSLIFKGFFLNGTLAIGPAHNWLSYELDGGKTRDDINFSGFVVGRISLGYNGDRFFGGLSFVNQGRNAKFDNLELTSSFGTFKILFGYRFKEVGFLKKRIWDLPKEIMN
jgi:hypothetical protein